MAEPGDRDAALLLDMLLAAKDAQGFVAGWRLRLSSRPATTLVDE